MSCNVQINFFFSSSSSFRVRPTGLFPIRINLPNCGSYRQVIGLLGRLISPIAKPLPTQNNINTEETRTFMPRVGFEPMTHCSSGQRQFML
jgi:hypothetical protein